MIFQVDAYDPSETDDRPRASYVSSKDWRVLGIAVILLGLILSPIYMFWRRQAWQHACTQNFQQIQNALNVYLVSNNDRYPPAFVTNENNEPLLLNSGQNAAPYTWISLIQSGMEKRASFECPAGLPEERAYSLHSQEADKLIPSTYGMYLPRAGWPASMIQDPDDAVIITETSNKGANQTYNPRPFADAPDGFVIAWDDSNDRMSPDSKFVTRLAFPETKDGKFSETGKSRHDAGINVLFCSGRRSLLKPSSAEIARLGKGGRATGYWADL